ncbi:hypothetical protein ACL02T_30250 [Pseudonocardia sp. RS010]|uniref:hypothetical protein n=1 Tax=Pseudonocardia sp. RS010 TaxID=3385979 RepID=UPI0039A345B6
MSEYGESAEYLHLLSLPMWEVLGPRLAAILADGPAEGTLVELGAGSGLGTTTILDAVPRLPLVVAEPAAQLRAVLLARLYEHPEGERVTVHPVPAQELPLPAKIVGVVGAHMIGHLPPSDRHALFTALAARMRTGAPLVLNAQPPATADPVPAWPPFGVTCGGLTYEGTGSAVPTGEDSVRWTMEYTTRQGAEVLHRATAEYDWWVHSPARLAAELAAAGLPNAEIDADLVIARR